MELSLITYGIGQKSGRVSISEDSVTFAGKSLRTAEVLSLSSSLKSSREVLYSSINGTITIKTNYESMILKFSGSDGMFQSKSDEVLQSFFTIRTQLIQHIGPLILSRMLQSIGDGNNLNIGKFIINHKGITSQSMLKGELRAGWEEDITLRPKNKENKFLKYFNAGLSASDKYDYWEVVYHNRYQGKVVNLGDFSYEDDNGCMIPFLISFIKQHS